MNETDTTDNYENIDTISSPSPTDRFTDNNNQPAKGDAITREEKHINLIQFCVFVVLAWYGSVRFGSMSVNSSLFSCE